MKKLCYYALALALFLPGSLSAQLKRSAEFHEKYQLKEVVVLSRHNIRSPLSTNGSALSKMTTHKWTNWSSAASELTLKGGVLETEMGQFFRKWTVSEGLFAENHVPTVDEVNVYANSMQRCVATASYFSTAFMPVGGLDVYHRYTPSTMDPVFNPVLTKNSPNFQKEAMKQINELGGKTGLEGLAKSLETSYANISKVLDYPESEAFKTYGDIKYDDTQISFVTDKEPSMKGTMKNFNSAADAFILQYYEEPDARKAAFGENLSASDWTAIAKVKDVYGDILFTAPIVAVNVAHPLLMYMKDELNSKNRKFTFLCGHDSNIASVNAALGVEKYSLPESIEKVTPIGSKVVYEVWADKATGKKFVAVNLVYQTTGQLQHNTPLDLEHSPNVFPLSFKGMEKNSDGLYTFESLDARFEKAINAYDDIK